jgi:hypothetical protein
MSAAARAHQEEPAQGVPPEARPAALGAAPAEAVLALQRTIGNRATRRALARSPVARRAARQLLARAGPTPAPTATEPRLKPGDTVAIDVSPRSGEPKDPVLSRRYQLGPTGQITLADGRVDVAVELAGLTLVEAAQRIADRLFEARRFESPVVSIGSPDGRSGAAAGISDPQFAALRDHYEWFLSYLKTTKEPADAVIRYYQWLAAHRSSPELSYITPPELWERSLRPPPARPTDARTAHLNEFVRFMQDQMARDRALTDPAERARATATMLRFQDWLDKHRDSEDFVRHDVAKVYADIWTKVLSEDVSRRAAEQVRAEREARERSPERMQARSVKFDEFMALAMELWGYSSRTFPYLIPIPSEGQDVLVTGDPARQAVLKLLGNALMDWAVGHMYDESFTRSAPKSVLADLLRSGYGKLLQEAGKAPLQAEIVDRNEIVAGKALAAFGKTVATGVLVIALVGLFVGAEVLTLGQATWILVALAGAGGVKAFLDRRSEIEATGYQVTIPETIVHSAGDAVGVSQLIEGISGQRLGTGMPLGSAARSEQFGVGTGNVATILIGSRAYRQGEAFGMSVRVPPRGLKPSGPNANVTDNLLPELRKPPELTPPAAGSKLAELRAKLTPETQVGFDRWVAEMKGRGGDPEKVLGAKSPENVKSISEQFARKHANELAKYREAQYLHERAADDPLRPLLKNVRREGKVWIHYEARPPLREQIDHAKLIAEKTGETVHLFGDTASGIDYPGIDGTIGSPPRPLSLKTHGVDANAPSARFAAQQALLKAKTHGYTQVEVRIRMPGKTRAEVEAAWNVKGDKPGAHDLGPYYEGDVIARIVIDCSDGAWIVPKGPALTGPAPNLQQPEPAKPKTGVP